MCRLDSSLSFLFPVTVTQPICRLLISLLSVRMSTPNHRHPNTSDSTELTQYIQYAQRELDRLSAAYSELTLIRDASRRSASDESHRSTLHQLRVDSTERANQLEAADHAWREVDGPRIRDTIDTLAKRVAEMQSQIAELTQSENQLTAEIEQMQVEEQKSHALVEATTSGFGQLPVSCLRHLVPFLTKSDLHSLCLSSRAFRLLFDRGTLWAIFGVRVVQSIIASQNVGVAAMAAERRRWSGLTPDYHNSNFLAACKRVPLQGSPPPVAFDDTAALPHNAACTVNITLSTKPVASVGAKSSAQPSVGGSLSRSDLFSRALTTLQQQIDPALSEFEDISLKISSHEATIKFLNEKTQEHRHQMGHTKCTHKHKRASTRCAKSSRLHICAAMCVCACVPVCV